MPDITRIIAMAVTDRQSAIAELADALSRHPDSGAAISLHQQLVDRLGQEVANELWLAACEANCPSSAVGFPGAPGSMWRDSDGDVWVHCADGRMRQVHAAVTPADANAVYGPMSPVEGA